MGTETGGTELYCPACNAMRMCKAHTPGALIFDSEYRQKRDGLYVFRRCRECLTCKFKFFTVEVRESLLDELESLRTATLEARDRLAHAVESLKSVSQVPRSKNRPIYQRLSDCRGTCYFDGPYGSLRVAIAAVTTIGNDKAYSLAFIGLMKTHWHNTKTGESLGEDYPVYHDTGNWIVKADDKRLRNVLLEH